MATPKKKLTPPFKVMGPTEYPTQNAVFIFAGTIKHLAKKSLEESHRLDPRNHHAMPDKQSGRLELAR